MSSSSRASEIAAVRAEIQSCLNEDPANLEWVLERVDRLAWVAGSGVHAGLLMLLCNVSFEETEARRHWEAMVKHRAALSAVAGRPAPLRAAMADYLIGLNQRAARPRLIDVIETLRSGATEMTDPLTSLRSKPFLDEQIARETSRAARFKIDLSYVHLEIDDFTRITERLGHSMGTILIQELAGIIRSSIRNIDYCARISGSEFGLLLTETDRMGAYHVADRIRQKLEAFHLERRVAGRPFELSISAGVASYPDDAGGPEELAARAREAWFMARARGTGRVATHYRERREFIRLTTDHEDLQIKLGDPAGDGSGPTATLKNISAGGVLFESDRPIEIGRAVQIECRNRRESGSVVIPGHVVRIERFENGSGTRYEIGVLFDLVVEEQLEGVIEFLERFSAGPAQPAA